MIEVFISHNHEDKRWVTTLANNLSQCGLSVWLDLLESGSRHSMAGHREQALETSHRGVLLATPNSIETDWLQEQYEAMRAKQQDDPNFYFIALFFGSTSKAGWIKSPLKVDFSRPEPAAYRVAFQKLLSGLHNQAATGLVEIPTELEIPKPHFPRLKESTSRSLTKGEEGCLTTIFQTLDGNRPVMLLGSADYDKTPIQMAILEEAQRHYPEGEILHLVPHGHADANKSEYFAYLCDQIGRKKNLNKASDFEYLLESMLSRGKSVFLFLTRIEEGSAEGRRALSHSLRNLSERYEDWFKLVLCGGENLLELRFKEGSLSPLRNAEPVMLPDPTVEDIQQWQANEAGGLMDEEIATLLKLTGGNPRLILQSLKTRTPFTPLLEEILAGKLSHDAVLRARFTAYRESANATRVASLLLREKLGVYELWPIQALLRHLYWDGLLAERDGRFCWRSDLVRQIGREVIGV